MSTFHLGQRLSTKGNCCTVRYIGQVEGKQGQWLGVEWDDATRGKHSGTHQGHEYFKCRSNSPVAGSFLRPTATWDKPRNFIEALRSKYAATEADSDVPYDPDIKIIRISGKTAEEVGFDKIARQQAQLHNLRIVLLDNMLIQHETHVDTINAISQTCPSILDLDIGRNLFETLAEIDSICAQLDKLRSLKLDGNRLRNFAGADVEVPFKGLSRITTLELNDMLLRVMELDEMLAYFPNLKNVSASSNQLASLDGCKLPQPLISVTLEDNNFTSLEDVASLNRWCHQLQTLSLKNNQITKAFKNNSRGQFVLPSSLTDLDLSYNHISSWEIIDDLEKVCPGLRHLRVSQNPLFESLKAADGKSLTSADGYILTIARLPNLETLNYSKITDKERLNAETYYLSQIAMQISLAPAAEEMSIIAQHPRYKALCEEYGEPSIERKSDDAVDPNSLAARLIKCSFHFSRMATDKSILPTKSQPFVAELPTSLSIYAVLGVLGKKFGLQPMRLRLIWETGDKEKVKAPPNTWIGVQEWDSSDEEAEEVGSGWQSREVELMGGTRPLSTVVEANEAKFRVEIRSSSEESINVVH